MNSWIVLLLTNTWRFSWNWGRNRRLWRRSRHWFRWWRWGFLSSFLLLILYSNHQRKILPLSPSIFEQISTFQSSKQFFNYIVKRLRRSSWFFLLVLNFVCLEGQLSLCSAYSLLFGFFSSLQLLIVSEQLLILFLGFLARLSRQIMSRHIPRWHLQN